MTDVTRLRHRMPVQLRFSDVDQFGHVNNSVYFSLYDLAKTTYVKEVLGIDNRYELAIVVANINANFLHPVFFSDILFIETSVVHIGNKSFTLLQRAVSEDTGEVVCECQTVMVAYDIKNLRPIPLTDSNKTAICNFEGKTLEELSHKEED